MTQEQPYFKSAEEWLETVRMLMSLEVEPADHVAPEQPIIQPNSQNNASAMLMSLEVEIG